MKFCVYIYRDPKSSVPVYVGMGKHKRPSAHLNKSHNPRLHAMIQKRLREGYQIQPDVLLVSSREEAVDMEKLLIAMIGRADKGNGPLFNFTDGGEGTSGIARKHSTATKLKMSSSHVAYFQKPGTREKTRISQMAHFQKLENRELLSKKMKERVEAGLHKGGRKPQPCTIDGVTIYPSRKSLIDALGQGCLGVKHPDFRYIK